MDELARPGSGRRARLIKVPPATEFTAHPGQGIEATVEGRCILVGKPGFVAGSGVDLAGLTERLPTLETAGNTVIVVAAAGRLLGLLAMADSPKADAADAVARLRSLGMTPVMLTGDNQRTADAVAATVGIDQVDAQVLPSEKADRIRRLQQDGARVGMVGDGINDAPALTQADVGIAVGAGTDRAIESSDVVIMGDRLTAVVDTYEIARASYRKTKQNLAIAFVFNGVGVPAAATGLVSPVFAMVAMVLSVTGVLANSFGGRLVRGQAVTSQRTQVTRRLAAHRGHRHTG